LRDPWTGLRQAPQAVCRRSRDWPALECMSAFAGPRIGQKCQEKIWSFAVLSIAVLALDDVRRHGLFSLDQPNQRRGNKPLRRGRRVDFYLRRGFRRESEGCLRILFGSWRGVHFRSDRVALKAEERSKRKGVFGSYGRAQRPPCSHRLTTTRKIPKTPFGLQENSEDTLRPAECRFSRFSQVNGDRERDNQGSMVGTVTLSHSG
jgi:hypothetical protein